MAVPGWSDAPRTEDAQVVALTRCPECDQLKGARCRDVHGRARVHPHIARHSLGLAILRERSRATFLGSATWPAARLSAWAAGREFDRDEAEALRWWLRRNGPILWDPTYVPPVV